MQTIVSCYLASRPLQVAESTLHIREYTIFSPKLINQVIECFVVRTYGSFYHNSDKMIVVIPKPYTDCLQVITFGTTGHQFCIEKDNPYKPPCYTGHRLADHNLAFRNSVSQES